MDTALKQLRQIREYEQRLKGLEQEVRIPGHARGVWLEGGAVGFGVAP